MPEVLIIRANMAVTMYDIAQQFNMLMSGEANIYEYWKSIGSPNVNGGKW